MDTKLLMEFLNETLESAREAIRILKAARLTNEQYALDFADELNRLSIEF